MNHLVRCPTCNFGLVNTPALAGQVVACPKCQSQFQMPQMSASPGTTAKATLVAVAPASSSPVPPPKAAPEPTPRPRRKRRETADRPRRFQPVVIAACTLLATIVIATIATGVAFHNARTEREEKIERLHGNWMLANNQPDPAVEEIKRFELALHPDGRAQKAINLGEKESLVSGAWKVANFRGDAAELDLAWSDAEPERWTATGSKDGQLQVDVPGLGTVHLQPKTSPNPAPKRQIQRPRARHP